MNRKMLASLFLVTSSFLLSGCAEDRRQASVAACSQYGFTVGTDAYARCVQEEFARREAAFSAGLDQFSRGMAQMGGK